MGKSLQPRNAIAVPQPVNTPAAASAAASATAAHEPVTAESLGWQLRAALPPLRLHSVSLYDEEANVLWLSEGALGPDEHGLVIEAIERLRRNTSQTCYENRLEDGRAAIFLPVRAPQGALVGLSMILADIKSVGDGVTERMITPQIRTIMQRVAVLVRAQAGRSGHTEASLPILEIAPEPAAVTAVQTGSVQTIAPPVLSPQAVDDILEFELTPDLSRTVRTLPADANMAVAAPAASSATATTAKVLTAATTNTAKALTPSSTTSTAKVLTPPANTGTAKTLTPPANTGTAKALGTGLTGTARTLVLPEGLTLSVDVQPFTKLRAGGRTRRYEVLASATHRDVQRVPPALDSYALQHLLSWLGSNRSIWNAEPTSFTLNLSINTLEDERFPQFVASNLKAHGIAPDNIGFEIAEPLCLQRRAQVERFVTLCDKLGCFVVIDDFSFDSSIVSLLRSKALRLVKIDAKLTSVALKDKLAQALVVAIAQAVKVLGIHCSAKRVESQAALQWLTAIGCDFAQGSVLALPQPLESLATPAAASEEGRPSA